MKENFRRRVQKGITTWVMQWRYLFKTFIHPLNIKNTAVAPESREATSCISCQDILKRIKLKHFPIGNSLGNIRITYLDVK